MGKVVYTHSLCTENLLFVSYCARYYGYKGWQKQTQLFPAILELT